MTEHVNKRLWPESGGERRNKQNPFGWESLFCFRWAFFPNAAVLTGTTEAKAYQPRRGWRCRAGVGHRQRRPDWRYQRRPQSYSNNPSDGLRRTDRQENRQTGGPFSLPMRKERHLFTLCKREEEEEGGRGGGRGRVCVYLLSHFPLFATDLYVSRLL